MCVLASSVQREMNCCMFIFSGLVFISLMGIILAPVAHRMLHKFHLDENDLDDNSTSKS